ncbi:MAG: SpoIIE family protein phosphatase [Cyclobacteriaceae bacterium]
MSTASLLGYFEKEENVAQFSINNSQSKREPMVNLCCQKMIKSDISSLTIELDDRSFLYFVQGEGNIRFVEGSMSDYSLLKLKVNEGTEGYRIMSSVIEEQESETQEPTLKPVHTADDHSRIPHSFLQPIERFKKAYSNAELFFKPFEDPGGDFYWTRDYQYKNLVVLGDSTGHGMQGAMISMSAMTLLKQFFRLPPTSIEDSVYEYHQIFKDLLEDEHGSEFDVELGMILLDKRSKSVTYMGSGINMLVKRSDGVQMYSSRKSKINKRNQESYKLDLREGDQLFISSDGITDQFDSNDRKRLGTKNFMKLVSDLPFPATKQDFLDSFHSFSGSTEALDDQSMLILTV